MHAAQHNIPWRLRAAAVAFLAAGACTTTPAQVKPDASMSAPTHPPHFVDGGPLPSARVTCADASCPGPAASQVLGELACCLPSGECGVRAPLLGDQCLAPNQPGSVDPSCPSFAAPNGVVAQGCCSPTGRCGYYDRFGDLGCIVEDATDGGKHCDYDVANMCRSVVAVSCDGPEDCGPGLVCCARSNFGLYDVFGCFTSCDAAEASARGVWVEVCHSRRDCPEHTDRCETAPGLFASAARCVPAPPAPPSDASVRPKNDGGSLDSGVVATDDVGASDAASSGNEGVTCGASQCPAGRTCCARDPGQPYCAPKGEGCSCSGPRSRERESGLAD